MYSITEVAVAGDSVKLGRGQANGADVGKSIILQSIEHMTNISVYELCLYLTMYMYADYRVLLLVIGL